MPDSGDETVLARVIPRDGRSRAYVDGRLATASELAELGAGLVDLYGQHAHQSLLDASVQRAALDRFVGTAAAEALAAYRAARAGMRRVDEDLAALGGDAHARAREIDLLRFQVNEIAAAGSRRSRRGSRARSRGAPPRRRQLRIATRSDVRTRRSKVRRSTRSAWPSRSSTGGPRSRSSVHACPRRAGRDRRRRARAAARRRAGHRRPATARGRAPAPPAPARPRSQVRGLPRRRGGVRGPGPRPPEPDRGLRRPRHRAGIGAPRARTGGARRRRPPCPPRGTAPRRTTRPSGGGAPPRAGDAQRDAWRCRSSRASPPRTEPTG